MKFLTVIKYIPVICTICITISCNNPEIQKSGLSSNQVMVLATLHGYHTKNPNYTYNDVFSIIENFDPDIIAVEMRPEDLKEDTAITAKFYPYEMRELLIRFPEKEKIGFDWLGAEAAGNKITLNTFKDTTTELGRIKLLERRMNADSALATKLTPLENLQKQQFDLIKDASAAQLNDGRYDSVTAIYYATYYSLLAGTQYVERAEFNRKRDEKIGNSIIQIIKQNPGKKIVFVTGADHRGFVVSRIIKEAVEQVNLIPVP